MKLYGVFIGVNEYEDSRIRPLSYARRDAETFFSSITKSISKDERECWLLVNEKATRHGVFFQIGEVVSAKATEDDMVLLYFSGHGSPEKSDANKVSKYLILYDTESDKIFTTGLDLEIDLVRLLHRIRSDTIIVIIDSCFSGRSGGRTFEGPYLKKSREDYRMGPKLSQLDLGESRVIISACDDEQVAYENSDLQHGVFTYFLLKTLSESDSHDDKFSISINSLYERVAMGVHQYTNGRQSPVINGRVRMTRFPLLSVE